MTEGGYWAAAHYTFYRRLTPEERRALSLHHPLTFLTGAQLRRVKPGDVLWVINVHQGRLFLIGRLLIEFVVDDAEVALELVEPKDEIWPDAEWYVISNRYSADPLREIDVTPLAGGLTFESDNYQLDLSSGVDANHLRALRRLTPEAAHLLEQVWYDDSYTPQDITDYLELTEDDKAYNEGKLVFRTIRERRRNRNLVEDAKALFKSRHGQLYCEACGFSFSDSYGVEYIEAHHVRQMASYDDEQTVSVHDLVMLCANCHRMVHIRTPPLNLEELRALLRYDGRDAHNGDDNK